ncbi:hypothetical protein [Stenotrophomonas phage BUCTxx99]|nr:hypothetical protein [Stenotrophomonas phage BUCTxx99]
MTRDQFEAQLIRVAEIQRNAGWSQESIDLYADDQRRFATDESLACTLMIGAGLAQDNSRYGVGD